MTPRKARPYFLSDALLVKGQYIYLILLLSAVLSTFLYRTDTVTALTIEHQKCGVPVGLISWESNAKKW